MLKGTVRRATARENCSAASSKRDLVSSGDPPTFRSTRVPLPETEGEVSVYSPRCWSPPLQPLLPSHQGRLEAAINQPNRMGVLKAKLWVSPETGRTSLMGVCINLGIGVV